MKAKSVALVTIAALVAGAFGLGMVAEAHQGSFASGVDINYGDGAFFGNVTSNKQGCRKNRTVQIIKNRRNRPDKVVDSANTGDDSAWSVSKPFAQGRYYSRVVKILKGSYGHQHTCLAARSPNSVRAN